MPDVSSVTISVGSRSSSMITDDRSVATPASSITYTLKQITSDDSPQKILLQARVFDKENSPLLAQTLFGKTVDVGQIPANILAIPVPESGTSTVSPLMHPALREYATRYHTALVLLAQQEPSDPELKVVFSSLKEEIPFERVVYLMQTPGCTHWSFLEWAPHFDPSFEERQRWHTQLALQQVSDPWMAVLPSDDQDSPPLIHPALWRIPILQALLEPSRDILLTDWQIDQLQQSERLLAFWEMFLQEQQAVLKFFDAYERERIPTLLTAFHQVGQDLAAHILTIQQSYSRFAETQQRLRPVPVWIIEKIAQEEAKFIHTLMTSCNKVSDLSHRRIEMMKCLQNFIDVLPTFKQTLYQSVGEHLKERLITAHEEFPLRAGQNINAFLEPSPLGSSEQRQNLHRQLEFVAQRATVACYFSQTETMLQWEQLSMWSLVELSIQQWQLLCPLAKTTTQFFGENKDAPPEMQDILNYEPPSFGEITARFHQLAALCYHELHLHAQAASSDRPEWNQAIKALHTELLTRYASLLDVLDRTFQTHYKKKTLQAFKRFSQPFFQRKTLAEFSYVMLLAEAQEIMVALHAELITLRTYCGEQKDSQALAVEAAYERILSLYEREIAPHYAGNDLTVMPLSWQAILMTKHVAALLAMARQHVCDGLVNPAHFNAWYDKFFSLSSLESTSFTPEALFSAAKTAWLRCARNHKLPGLPYTVSDGQGRNLLHLAVEHHLFEVAYFLLRQGYPLGTTDEAGVSMAQLLKSTPFLWELCMQLYHFAKTTTQGTPYVNSIYSAHWQVRIGYQEYLSKQGALHLPAHYRKKSDFRHAYEAFVSKLAHDFADWKHTFGHQEKTDLITQFERKIQGLIHIRNQYGQLLSDQPHYEALQSLQLFIENLLNEAALIPLDNQQVRKYLSACLKTLREGCAQYIPVSDAQRQSTQLHLIQQMQTIETQEKQALLEVQTTVSQHMYQQDQILYYQGTQIAQANAAQGERTERVFAELHSLVAHVGELREQADQSERQNEILQKQNVSAQAEAAGQRQRADNAEQEAKAANEKTATALQEKIAADERATTALREKAEAERQLKILQRKLTASTNTRRDHFHQDEESADEDIYHSLEHGTVVPHLSHASHLAIHTSHPSHPAQRGCIML